MYRVAFPVFPFSGLSLVSTTLFFPSFFPLCFFPINFLSQRVTCTGSIYVFIAPFSVLSFFLSFSLSSFLYFSLPFFLSFFLSFSLSSFLSFSLSSFLYLFLSLFLPFFLSFFLPFLLSLFLPSFLLSFFLSFSLSPPYFLKYSEAGVDDRNTVGPSLPLNVGYRCCSPDASNLNRKKRKRKDFSSYSKW